MSDVFSGPKAMLYKDGTRVGYATDVSGSLDLTQVPIETLGDIDPVEIVTTGRRASGSVGRVRLSTQDAVSLGLIPGGGATTAEVVEFGGITMQVYDQVGDRVLYQFEGVKFSGVGWSVGARSITIENMSFVGLRMKLGTELG